MIRRLLSRLYWWAHKQKMRRDARKRLADLERRLANHDMDMASVEHFPQPVQMRMWAYRRKLVKQILAARRVVFE